MVIFLAVFMSWYNLVQSYIMKSVQDLVARLYRFRVVSMISMALLEMASWNSSTRSEMMWPGGAGGLGTLKMDVSSRSLVRSRT